MNATAQQTGSPRPADDRVCEVEIHCDTERDLALFVLTGIADIQATIDDIEAHFAEHGTRLAIWDVRALDVTAIGIDDLRQLAACFQRIDPLRTDGRNAVLLASRLVKMLGSLYRAVNRAKRREITAKSFLSVKEALSWLDVDRIPEGWPL